MVRPRRYRVPVALQRALRTVRTNAPVSLVGIVTGCICLHTALLVMGVARIPAFVVTVLVMLGLLSALLL